MKTSFCHESPVFIRKNVETARLQIDEIPVMLTHRLLSVRGFDKKGMMLAATTIEGLKLHGAIDKIFNNANVEYIHIHNSGPGCFNCEVVRVNEKIH